MFYMNLLYFMSFSNRIVLTTYANIMLDTERILFL